MATFIRKNNNPANQSANMDTSEHEIKLRMTAGDYNTKAVNDHVDLQSPYSTVKSDNEIRHLSFFKEQERQFTEPADEEEWQERQSPINFVLVSAVIIVTAVAGWFCYRWLNPNQSSQPPIISVEQESFKVRPENPGGMIIPHQDKLIYNRLAPEQGQQQPVERLLPLPEQPIAALGYGPQPYVDQNGQVIYPEYQQPLPQNYQQPYPAAQPSQPQYQQQPVYQQQQLPEPMQQQPQAVHPGHAYGNQQPMQQQQAQLPYGYPQQLPAQPAPIPTQAQPPIQDPQQRNLPTPLPPLPTQSLAAQPQPSTQQQQEPQTANVADSDKLALESLIAQETESSPAKAAPATKAEPATGKYRVQIATFNNEKEAITEANRLKKLDAPLFKDRAVQVIKSESSQSKKSLYRVVVVGFGTANQAAQFSSKLRVHKIKGIVLNPTNG